MLLCPFARWLSLVRRDSTLFINIQDTVTGMLLAGTGERGAGGKSNWLVVEHDTPPGTIRETFREFTQRQDIAIILINQHIANIIRADLVAYTDMVPTVLEIPSKAHPYDPSKDQVLKQVNMLLGGE